MAFEYFLFGIFVKIITGLDDTITHVPVLASIAKTRMGQIAFSIGTLLAIIAAIVAALFFAAVLQQFPYYRYVAAMLVFLLALSIYCDLFVHEPRAKAEKRILKNHRISAKRFGALLGVGFVASVATVLDDVIAYMPLFLVSNTATFFAILGILVAAIIEIVAVIYFSERIISLPYKEEIASLGLVVLGVLLMTGVV